MNGYSFSHEVDSKVVQGLFRSDETLSNATSSQKVSVKTRINTHTHGIQLMHSVDEIKKITTIPAQRVKNILQRLFRKGKRNSRKLLSLDTSDFYAFIINNIKQLKEEFREIMATQDKQLSFIGEAKTSKFTIPDTELYKYTEVKQVELMKRMYMKDIQMNFCHQKHERVSRNAYLKDSVRTLIVWNGYTKMETPDSSIFQLYMLMA